ncbi:hypothetical protein PF007_g9410 [Phytophthora fragariae]|uniref:Uncharacterized protein n=1 Tax=Phytophthora fragariae TaxID=53985 RepID=A0A6A3SJ23_9STRA|nr:hypothetical protein PF007_g9410 [Phytophthora fragariae]
MKPVGNAMLHRRAQEESIAQVRHDVEEKSIAQIHRQVPVSVAQVYAFSRVGSVFRRLLIDYPSDEESEQEELEPALTLAWNSTDLSTAAPSKACVAMGYKRATKSCSQWTPKRGSAPSLQQRRLKLGLSSGNISGKLFMSIRNLWWYDALRKLFL